MPKPNQSSALRTSVLLGLTAALILVLLGPASSEAAFYRGGGKRIQVELQIVHDRLIYGRIKTSAFCQDRHKPHRRYLQRIDAVWGDYVHRLPPKASTETYNFVAPVRGGRLDEHNSGLNTSVASYSAYSLRARVGSGAVRGSYLEATTGLFSYPSEHADCRTDHYWRAGTGGTRTEPLHFLAKRVPGGRPPGLKTVG